MSDDDIRNFYQTSYLTLLPLKNSLQPSGQSVALQSMSCGTPVIITKTQGFWEPDLFSNYEDIIFVDKNNIESVENNIEGGDIGIALATVCHGVAPVEGLHNSSEGRWFLSLYSNESDEVKNRHTSSPFKPQLNLDIKKQIFPQI